MANFPLVITSPRSTLGTNARPRRAYPGIEYNVRITAMGGNYPYTYSMSGQPSGMIVNSSTGVITWSNPIVGTYAGIQVSVNDGATTVNETFSLTVTTSGFQFIDSVSGNDTTGTGTIGNPWRTIDRMYDAGAAAAITIFRAGTYLLTGLPTVVGSPAEMEHAVEWAEDRSVIWLAYPGETVVIDFEHDGTFCTPSGGGFNCVGVRATPRLRFTGNSTWIDGIRFTRMFIMALQMMADAQYLGWTVRRCTFDNGGPGANGSNGSMVMAARTNSTFKYGSYLGECAFSKPYYTAGLAGIDCIKTYEEQYLLIADNTFTDQAIFSVDGAIAIKGAHNRYEIRTCTIAGSWIGAGIGGNTSTAANGEVRFNLVITSGTQPSTGVAAMAYHIGQGPDPATNTFVTRNTFVGGRVRFWVADANNGPFTCNYNVIQNGDSGQLTPFVCDGTPSFNPGSQQWSDCFGVADPSKLIINNNLGATSGLVDSSGNLIAPYLSYIGTHGHMIAAVTPPSVNMRYAGIRCR